MPLIVFERKVRAGAGMRLDKYLHQVGLGLSRTQIQKLIEEGKVLVNGRPVKPSYTLKRGDEIYAEYERKEPLKIEPEPIPLDIIYEDDYIVVVNKPAGMVTHPAPGNLRGTLVNALLHHCGLAKADSIARPGVVHRLDKDTSGVIVFAKEKIALSNLAEQLQKRRMKKEYLTFVWGNLPLDKGIIDAPIGRDFIDRKKMAVTPLLSKDAITEYFVEKRYKYITFARVHILTGRTHQIRVHMAHIGHPVVGDETYQGRQRLSGIPHEFFEKVLEIMQRQALHSHKLGFEHPVTKKWMEFEAPLPEDMRNLKEFLEAQIN